jgi:hypothetical protein
MASSVLQRATGPAIALQFECAISTGLLDTAMASGRGRLAAMRNILANRTFVIAQEPL